MIKPTAYGGLLMLVLLSKIEEIDTFKATNLHQNGTKTYLKRITMIIHYLRLPQDSWQNLQSEYKFHRQMFLQYGSHVQAKVALSLGFSFYWNLT